MIDTVGIQVPNNGKMNFSKLRNNGNYKVLRNYRKRINTSVGYYNYNNFLIEKPINEADKRDIKLYGSLQKLVNNQNIIPNSIESIKLALENFSDDINIDLFNQDVFRVDICKDFEIDSVENILSNIYPINEYNFKEEKGTRYYDKWKSDYFKACFYDKGKEAKQNKNESIRHEIRLYKRFLRKNNIITLRDVFNRLNSLESIRVNNMKDFKAKEIKEIDLTGTRRDLILRAREIGVNEILKQIKDEYSRKLISRRTYFNRKKIINSNIDLIENQEFEMLKIIEN